jgi:hypothetical protein
LGERLASASELIVCFEGHFSYDEDQDDVHPREFRNEFEIGANIVVVPKHDGSILTLGRQAWPRSITGQPPRRNSNLAAEVRGVLAVAWGDEVEEDSEEREVGTVGGTSITRHVTIYRRVPKQPDDE